MVSTRSDDFHAKVFGDFPDGFLMSYDTTPNSESDDGVTLHVYDILMHPDTETGNPRCLLRTMEQNPGKVFDIVIDDYEVFDHEPTQAHVTVEGMNKPMTWSDNLSDDMRAAMINKRTGGVDLPDEEDPPLRGGSIPESPSDDVAKQVLDAAATPDETPAETAPSPDTDTTAPDGTVTITQEQADADPGLKARAQIADLLKGDS